MKTFVSLAVLLLAVSAFAAVPPVGTWEWAATEESPGDLTTPADVGYNVQREFLDDGLYYEFRNEAIHRSGTYWVDDVEFMGLIIPALYIECGDDPTEVCAYLRGPGTLELYWGADGGGYPSYPIEVLVYWESVPNETSTWGGVKNLFR